MLRSVVLPNSPLLLSVSNGTQCYAGDDQRQVQLLINAVKHIAEKKLQAFLLHLSIPWLYFLRELSLPHC